MKLERWALVAEIVSGAAVVITLLFLIVGILENTRVTRVSVYSNLMDGLNDFDMRVVSDPQLRESFELFIQEEVQETPESARGPVFNIAGVLFKNYEKAYFAYRFDAIGDQEWDRFADIICINDRRVVSAGLDLSELLTSDFEAYIATNCRERSE